MGYRIMQIQKNVVGRKYEVIQGINFKIPPKIKYAKLHFIGNLKNNIVTHVKLGDITGSTDEFIDINLFFPEENDEEGAILLFIDNISHIETNATKIFGRYPKEGVFVLNPGDKIKVFGDFESASFVAIQYERKMYLMKLYD